jgi:hypothetical protein
MYPFCKDCIHQKIKWIVPICDHTKLSTQQSRMNPKLCSENAYFFSPKFSKLNYPHGRK